MARCEECIHNKVCAEVNSLKCRPCFIWYDAKSGCPYYAADVVPISDFERLQSEVRRLKKYDEERDIALHARLIAETSEKVSSEIFNEIENEINMNMSVISKILNTKGGRANGKTVLVSKYDVFIEAKKHLIKLKKKYIVEAHENAERCVSCGEIIPEGRQVCPTCENESKYFSPEDVRRMTAKDVRDNYTAIMESMRYWK